MAKKKDTEKVSVIEGDFFNRTVECLWRTGVYSNGQAIL